MASKQGLFRNSEIQKSLRSFESGKTIAVKTVATMITTSELRDCSESFIEERQVHLNLNQLEGSILIRKFLRSSWNTVTSQEIAVLDSTEYRKIFLRSQSDWTV